MMSAAAAMRLIRRRQVEVFVVVKLPRFVLRGCVHVRTAVHL